MHKLEIRNLSKKYGNGVEALKEVSLSLSPGLFGLLGPNGAGKSTLMQIIATLRTADSGSVHFNGTDILEHPEYMRKRLGYLPQEFGVYPGIPADRLMDHLAVLKGIFPKKKRREQINALLDKTNLYEYKNRAVSTFSGGMRRRFGIAQALLGEPGLIIVDEPTAGLDPGERNRFHHLLSELGKQAIVIMSTHIVEDVQNLCSDMAVIDDGRMLLQGNPAGLTGSLEGHVWQKTIPSSEIKKYQNRMDVISHRLHSGNTQIRVRADRPPGEGFEAVDPDLKDLYFSTLQQPEITLQ